MKEIFKNVRNKLAEKYLDNSNLKTSKKLFKIRRQFILQMDQNSLLRITQKWKVMAKLENNIQMSIRL